MCGIVGYTGHLQAAPILLDGLSKLEYRGYDSAGLAVRNGEKKTEIVKAKGRLKSLAEKTDNGRCRLVGTCGIVIPEWQRTVNQARLMHIRICQMMAMWLVFTMVLLKIIRS